VFAIHVLLICLCKGVNNFSITPNNLTSFLKNIFSLPLTEPEIFGYTSALIQDNKVIVNMKLIQER
jgi:hypothetical protein